MKLRSRLILLAVMVVAAISATATYFLQSDQPDNALRASGTIEATEVDVSFQIPGKVAQVLVEEGQQVSKGEMLATMASNERQARLEQIEASLEAVRSQARQQEDALQLRQSVVENQVQQARSQTDASRFIVERLREGSNRLP